MRGRGRWLILGFVIGTMLPNDAHAQASPPPARTALDALVEELRLLRRAIERQNVTTSRAQLLMGRLSLQDQRVARARLAVERLEAELASAERQQSQMQSEAPELARALEQTSDDARRQAVEQEARVVRARLADNTAAVSKTEARLTQAKESLDAEAGRYQELESWLTDLDRQVQRGGS